MACWGAEILCMVFSARMTPVKAFVVTFMTGIFVYELSLGCMDGIVVNYLCGLRVASQ